MHSLHLWCPMTLDPLCYRLLSSIVMVSASSISGWLGYMTTSLLCHYNLTPLPSLSQPLYPWSFTNPSFCWVEVPSFHSCNLAMLHGSVIWHLHCCCEVSWSVEGIFVWVWVPQGYQWQSTLSSRLYTACKCQVWCLVIAIGKPNVHISMKFYLNKHFCK